MKASVKTQPHSIMKNIFTLFLASFLAFSTTYAQKNHTNAYESSNCIASNIPMDILQSDGKIVTVVRKGNMLHHWTETIDGYTVVTVNDNFEYATKIGNDLVSTGILAHNPQDRLTNEMSIVSAISKSLEPVIQNIKNNPLNYTANRNKSYPTTGNVKVLALLIEFPDLASTYLKSDLQSLLNNPNHANGKGSFSSYYAESSFGQLNITVDVKGWYTAQNNYAYYSDSAGSARAAKLAREAVNAAEADGTNFALYDNNSDGNVDGIMIIHAGPGAETPIPNSNRHIWSHRWVLNGGASVPGGGAVTYDGKYINDYMINPETRGTLTTPRLVGIGVFCHEFGHNVNLSDLYDTDASNGDSEGIGNWGIMGGGGWLGGEHLPGGFCAWSKEKLGWITPTTLSSSTNGAFSLKPASVNLNEVYKITTPAPNEYFLIENRQNVGKDSMLPGHGLAIWHINTNQTSNKDETMKMVDLEEADGLNGLDNETNRGDAGDLFPGSTNKTSFDSTTNPNSRLYNLSNSGLRISNIVENADSIKFDLGSGATSAATCSGLTLLSAASGVFDDGSGNTANYDNNQNCSWLIQPPLASSITLNFILFNTEAANDVVKVYDGTSSTATLIGTYSGTTIPATITSTGGALFVEFITNGSITASGWDAFYSSTGGTPTCSGLTTLTNPTGSFTDGSNSNNYSNNLNCTWLIQPTGASAITANFTALNTVLGTDVVKIYNGTSATAPLIGTYSGTTLPSTIIANAGSMFVEFITNASGTAQGWAISYSSIIPPPVQCSGTTTLTTNSGSFSDGSGVSIYQANRDCRWLIQPTNNQLIRLNFSAFDTETIFDRVVVYNGSTINSPILGTFSGSSLPPQLTSTGNSMLVRFTTDNSGELQGWDATYTTFAPGATCSGLTNLTTPTGTFSDGSGNLNYSNNLSCEWLIAPPNASSITANFMALNIEINADFVSVYDGNSASAPLIGSYSGSTLPPSITANSGQMFVVFTTNSSFTNTGWTINYTSVGASRFCSGTTNLTANSGSFSDGSGTSLYQDTTHCSWLIQPANNQAVQLNFTSFNTELGFDLVRVYDGTTSSAPLLGAFSGNVIPSTLTSTGGAMLVEFTTDVNTNFQGWDAFYTTSSAVYCTGLQTLTTPTGSFSDGSGPTNYQDNSNCNWLIQVSGAGSIALDFPTFNTEVNNDVVTVYDGIDATSTVLGTFSGNLSTIPTINSSGSALYVNFSSNGSVNAAGWSAIYTTSNSAGIQLNPDTIILSPLANASGLFSITTNLSWAVSDNANWLTSGVITGTGNANSFAAANSANTSVNSRIAKIWCNSTSSSDVDSIVVIQLGNTSNFIDFANNSVSLGFLSGNNTTVNLQSNVNWTISKTGGNWLSFNPKNGTNNAAILLTTTADNTSGSSRTAWLYATDNTNTVIDSLEVIQQNGVYTVLTLSKSVITLSPAASSLDSFLVSSNVGWTLSGIPTWLTVNPSNGINNAQVNISTNSTNNTGNVRSATITATALTPGTSPKTIIINQLDGSGPYIGTIADTVILAQFQGSTNIINVLSNSIWTAQEGLNWLLIGPTSGNNNGTINLQASSANLSTQSRSGDVVISSTGLSNKIVHVIQLGATPSLGVNKVNVLIAGAANSKANFSVLGNASNWSISNQSNWLSIAPSTGSFNTVITLTAITDNFNSLRKDTLFVSAPNAPTQMVIVTQDFVTSIENKSLNAADMVIYPNPTNGKTTLKVDGDFNLTDYRINLVNILGAEMTLNSIQKINNQNYEFNLSGFNSGIYFMVISNDKTRIVKRIAVIDAH